MDKNILDLSSFDNILFYLSLSHKSFNILFLLLDRNVFTLSKEEITKDLISHAKYLTKHENLYVIPNSRLIEYLLEKDYEINEKEILNLILEYPLKSTILKFYEHRQHEYNYDTLSKTIILLYENNKISFDMTFCEEIFDIFCERMDTLGVDTVKLCKTYCIDYKKYQKI